jgi:predicted  nucleic acid-binding Zn-ribbon protein
VSVFADLLVVQGHDTTIDQLTHRKASMPERAELRAAESKRAELEARRAQVASQRDEIAARQAHAEADIAGAVKRVGEVDTRMRSGQVSAARDLQAMEGEIASIRRRISTLEDAALEAMEEREPLDSEVDELESAIAALDEQAARLRDAIGAEAKQIDADVEAERRARSEGAATIPADLLTTYERLRARLGGIGAAVLDGNHCTGCHLTLPATEIDRLKREPPDTLVYCDQCGRILVRS